ncbi:MAG: type II secretion system protein GspG [Planctomycetota bacterium]
MTLVEVLAVVVILGLLAATLTVGFSGAFGKGKRELARTGVGIVAGKLETYRLEHGDWPESLEALTAPAASPSSAYYLGPGQLVDPWDQPYRLVVPGPDDHPYEVVSLGQDGVLGGEGEAADVSSIDLRGQN